MRNEIVRSLSRVARKCHVDGSHCPIIRITAIAGVSAGVQGPGVLNQSSDDVAGFAAARISSALSPTVAPYYRFPMLTGSRSHSQRLPCGCVPCLPGSRSRDASARCLMDARTSLSGRTNHSSAYSGICYGNTGRLLGRSGARHVSTGATSSPGGDGDTATLALQMIEYSRSCRKDERHDEAERVLEQGLAFLSREMEGATGSGVATAMAGRVLLDIASLNADNGKITEAHDALDRVLELAPNDVTVRVAALEAKTSLFLQFHKDEEAVTCAQDAVEVGGRGVDVAKGDAEENASAESGFRAWSLLGVVKHACGKKAEAAIAFSKANEIMSTALQSRGLHEAAGIAGALKAHAAFAHCAGDFDRAQELYRQVLGNVQAEPDESQPWESRFPAVGISSQPAEVAVDSLMGLGQLALHKRDFDEAESRLTEALNRAEEISGKKHRRVGIVLSAIADLYAKRARLNGTGETLVAEGLHRRALELLRASVFELKEHVSNVRYSDVVALTRARYAVVLNAFKNRQGEAQREQAWAEKEWRAAESLCKAADAPFFDAAVGDETRGEHGPDSMYPVLDARHGRVFF